MANFCKHSDCSVLFETIVYRDNIELENNFTGDEMCEAIIRWYSLGAKFNGPIRYCQEQVFGEIIEERLAV